MSRTPLLFFGHGSPMNALPDFPNETPGAPPFSSAWKALGETIAKPRAMLMVSAHWYVPETAVTAMAQPRTIHDFGGFPQPLYDMQYPAPGAPWLGERVAQILAPLNVRQDHEWGLDHGTWSVLVHVWPEADVPVVQLAIDKRQEPRFHYELGQRLAPLRDEGVIIAGSGDVVHNLRLMGRTDPAGAAMPWASAFNYTVREAIASGAFESLIDYQAYGRDALYSVPTPEHYLPLLYVLGAASKDEPVAFFNDVIDLASISMLGVKIG